MCVHPQLLRGDLDEHERPEWRNCSIWASRLPQSFRLVCYVGCVHLPWALFNACAWERTSSLCCNTLTRVLQQNFFSLRDLLGLRGMGKEAAKIGKVVNLATLNQQSETKQAGMQGCIFQASVRVPWIDPGRFIVGNSMFIEVPLAIFAEHCIRNRIPKRNVVSTKMNKIFTKFDGHCNMLFSENPVQDFKIVQFKEILGDACLGHEGSFGDVPHCAPGFLRKVPSA